MKKRFSPFAILKVLFMLIPLSAFAGSLSQQSFKASNGTSLNYWLYTPDGASANMPLIVYLHDESCKGSDLNLILKDGFPKMLKNGEIGNMAAYAIIPQLPSNIADWKAAQNAVQELINKVSSNHGINKRKISLTGFSMGGTGCIELAAANPALYSCIAPVSAKIQADSKTSKALAPVGVWAIAGSKDNVVDPKLSSIFIETFSIFNSNAKITILDGADHNTVLSRAYKETQVINFLLSQSK